MDEEGAVFALWPGLEYHLELSFLSLDPDGLGVLPYKTLEPLLRHHILQMGLIEYATRFVDEDGKLIAAEVAEYMDQYKIDLNKDLGMNEWKYLVRAWIRRLADAQEQDVATWQKSLKEMQQEQAFKYQHAMVQFQKHYIQQLDSYYKSIDVIHKQEEAYRKEWETSLEMQEDFFKSQMDYLRNKNAEAENYMKNQIEGGPAAEVDALKQLKLGRDSERNGEISVVRFMYPASVTSTGAPVSAGAQMPCRRPLRRQKSACC